MYKLCWKVYFFAQDTGKSLSKALLFAEHWEKMLCTKNVLNARDNFCTQHVLPRFELGIFMYGTCNSMNNLLSYCGLVNAKIRAFDKDLPVWSIPWTICHSKLSNCFRHDQYFSRINADTYLNINIYQCNFLFDNLPTYLTNF